MMCKFGVILGWILLIGLFGVMVSVIIATISAYIRKYSVRDETPEYFTLIDSEDDDIEQ